jgi:uncharacterized membrane protein YtjA (UPF0391 family)
VCFWFSWNGSFSLSDEIIINQKFIIMLRWTLTFLIIAVIAAILGFGGIAAGAASIAKIVFFVFLVLLVISLIRGAASRS